MIENYYEILGVSIDSSLEEIKKAYRRKAIESHPDKNRDPKANEEFDRLTKAYNFLCDASKRSSLDNFLKQQHFESSRSARGTDLRTTIHIKSSDLIREAKKIIIVKRKGICPSCSGTGSIIKKTKKCNFCNGTGLQGMALILGQKRNCKYCNGKTFLPQGDKCPKCKGQGLVIETIKHEIKLNPLSDVIVIPEMGNYFSGKSKAGDLIIELEIEQDPCYKVKGLDVSTSIGISPAQAVLGDIISLNFFGKKIDLHIPPGTKHNDIIEQKNGGITYGGKTGLFRATIKIITPDVLTEEERDLYNKLLSVEKRSHSWPIVLSL